MDWRDLLPPSEAGKGKKKINLPSLDVRGQIPAVFSGAEKKTLLEGIPNASLIYGVGASFLFVSSLYSLFTGSWFTAFLLLFPAGALFGYAVLFIRHGK